MTFSCNIVSQNSKFRVLSWQNLYLTRAPGHTYNLHTNVWNHKIMLTTECLKRTGLVAVPKVTGHNGNALLKQRNMAMSTVLASTQMLYVSIYFYEFGCWAKFLFPVLHCTHLTDEVDLLFTKREEHRTR